MNQLSIDVWFIRIGHYFAEIPPFKTLESEGEMVLYQTVAKKKQFFLMLSVSNSESNL